jgi:hypothetical protein
MAQLFVVLAWGYKVLQRNGFETKLRRAQTSKHWSLDCRASALDILDNIWIESSLLVETHLRSKGGLWYPSG